MAENPHDDCFLTDFLRLDHSYGYNCHRLYNLCSLNDEILVHATGRLLHFYNVQTGQLLYKRTLSGQGIGHITTYQSKNFLAVGEKGENPLIIVYQWPELSVTAKLSGGGSRGFSCLSFNADCSLLASVSCAPDHLITLWVWQRQQILLQTKAFDQIVHDLTFSQFDPGQLATCGAGHVKVWRMSETFTGLKLKSELCRFGKSETCDLFGVVPLPDGSCATGSSWGNLLIWAEGAIRLQVYRVGHLPCHIGPITQLMYHYDALLTAGLDGAIRGWHYETIELADPEEEDPHIEMEPLFEVLLEDSLGPAQIMSLCKATSDVSSNLWFAQDKNGGIWRCMISKQESENTPERIFSCHAGAVVSLQASSAAALFASLGVDGKIVIYNYAEKCIVTSREFFTAGTCLIWPSLTTATSAGELLLAGFSDGVTRLLGLNKKRLSLLQVLKPHTRAVVCMSLQSDLLVTASRDNTVFLIRLVLNREAIELQPIGFCSTVAAPTCLAWCDAGSFLVGCESSAIFKFFLPSDWNVETEKSYRLHLKSLEIETEVFLSKLNTSNDNPDDESTPKKGPIRFLWVTHESRIRFSCENLFGVFEFNLMKNTIRRMDDNQLSCYVASYLYSEPDELLLLGLDNGKVQAMKMSSDDVAVSDWCIGTHDKDFGVVREMAVSWDGLFLFSCGEDGAVFSYALTNASERAPPLLPLATIHEYEFSNSVDIEQPTALSLEESKMKDNSDARERAVQKQKETVRAVIAALRVEYRAVLDANGRLPAELRVAESELVPDLRVVDHLRANMHQEMQLVYRKLGRDSERSRIGLNKIRGYFLDDIEVLTTHVEAIKWPDFVTTFRLQKLPSHFMDNLADVIRKLELMEARGSTESAPQPPEVQTVQRPKSPDPVETLMKQVSTLCEMNRSRKLTALWRQHQARKVAEASRAAAWEELMRREPDPRRSLSDDLAVIDIARETFGDYKLKMSADHKIPRHRIETTVSKQKALLETFLLIHETINEFNKKVLALRSSKQIMVVEHARLRGILERIANEIAEEDRRKPPDLPTVRVDLEFPEKMFSLEWDDVQAVTYQSDGDTTVETVQGVIYNIGEARQNDATELAIEMRALRIINLIEDQTSIIDRMKEDISQFDEKVRTLFEEKIAIEVHVKFLDLQLLMLRREVLVLQQFEMEESLKSEKSYLLLKEKYELQVNMNVVTSQMEEIVKDIQSQEEDIKMLVSSFMVTIAENKYNDYLKKIFKRKYKPPKAKLDDSEDSYSSESESDSEEEEGKSLDSKEFLTHFDESICPEGCDNELYERTFLERDLRYKLEIEVTEKKRAVDGLKKRFEALTKQMMKTDVELKRAQREYDALQRDKQTELNKIETVVVLRLSQMQNFKQMKDLKDGSSSKELENLDDSLVFSADLLAQLHNRVGELTRETQQQKDRHHLNKQHIIRLGIDIRHMTEQIKALEKEKEETMLRKFGCKVNLDELDEALVKKLVAEMHFIPFELQKKLDVKLEALKKKLIDKIETYTTRLTENTQRCNILAELREQRNQIEEVLERQETHRSTQVKAPDFSDVEKLAKIVKCQEKQAATLRQEICYLRQKACPVPAPGTYGPPAMQMLDTVLIRGPDKVAHEVSCEIWDRVKDMAEESEELLHLVKAEFGVDQASRQLRRLVEEMMGELPEAVLRPVWEDICQGRDDDLELGQLLEEKAILTRAAEILINMVHSTSEKCSS